MTAKDSGFYRPELDALRFVAFLLVFLYHGLTSTSGILESLRNAGALGVCLFFLLSAYLITELLEREKKQSGAIHLRAFYMRRILRIWPLYLTVLFIDYFFHRCFNPGAFTTSRLIAFLLLAGNWYVAHHGWSSTISAPLWSIPVEEQFYILWPSVRKRFQRSGAIVFSLLMLFLAYLALFYLTAAHRNHVGVSLPTTLWANSFVQFQFFSSGTLLALFLRGKTPKLHLSARILLCSAGLALLGAAQVFFSVITEAIPGHLYTVWGGYLSANAGCVLLFLSFLGEHRIGQVRPLVYLGKISYGLYVFHWMMLRLSTRLIEHLPQMTTTKTNAIQLALALILTIALASLSYRFFESPILRYKRRFEFIKTRAV